MSTSPDPKPQPGPARLWVRVLLVISLALNLLVAGVAIGTVMRFGLPGERPHSPSVGAMLYRALPDEDRKALRDSMKKARENGPDRRENRLAEIQAVVDALLATPFDPDALEAVASAQSERRHDGLETGQKIWLDRVVGLSPEARRAYADRLLELMIKMPDRKGMSGGRQD